MVGGYEYLAAFYDRLMSGFDYDKYLNLVLSNTKAGQTLDLACGSGRFYKIFAERGYKVTAVDSSAAMLNIATTSTKASLGVRYISADMTKLPFDKTFDLITIVCDGVNYLSQTQIDPFFNSISARLNNNGVFIFDISSEQKLKQVLGNNFYFEDLPEVTYFWQNKLSDDCVNLELTFFAPENALYRRYDERQKQYIHTRNSIQDALTKNGFIFSIFDGITFLPFSTDNTDRLIFVCHKK